MELGRKGLKMTVLTQSLVLSYEFKEVDEVR